MMEADSIKMKVVRVCLRVKHVTEYINIAHLCPFDTKHIVSPAWQGYREPPFCFLNLNLKFLGPLTAKQDIMIHFGTA